MSHSATGDLLADPGLDRVNGLPPEKFRATFAQCLNIGRWVESMLDERPFPDRSALLAAADRHARTITADELASALARHPRIGERASGADRESAWSRGEQAQFGATSGSEEPVPGATDAFQVAQVAYEARFGHIYLVCATGRTRDEILADIRARLSNDTASEQRVVIDELRKIALLRIGKALDNT